MLQENLSDKFWKISHPKEGEILIDGEKIVNIKKMRKKFSPHARSVDVTVETKNANEKLIFYGFMKFSKEQGTATTTHQLNEAKLWLKQAMIYSQANDDNINFFCISDGKEGERNIKTLEHEIRFHKSRILVGNTTSIINSIKEYEK